MTGSGDRLYDARQRPTFQIDRAAVAYIPRVGPAAWAVYCYLLARAAEGETRWPDTLTIATACGLSTYNADLSLRALLDNGLIGHHAWTDDPGGPAIFAILPVAPPADTEPPRPAGRRASDIPIGTDRLVSEDSPDEETWRREAQERNETRELFGRFLDALGVDPSELSEHDRTTVTEASRLARAAGATPDEVSEMIDRVRLEQPDLALDADRMLEYWSRLFRELDEEKRENESR